MPKATTALSTDDAKTKSPYILRLERNLNLIGFFSASKVRSVKSRSIETRRLVDGRTYSAKTTLLPSPDHGLPNTSDQDKYLALMHLVNQIKLRDTVVRNPICFTSNDLISILDVCTSGRNYLDIEKWLQRMVLTGIVSEGSIYLAQRKKYVIDTFHAFDRVIIAGDELPDGSRSQSHRVYLGEWLLDSFNHNYVLPIEMEGYRKLNSPLAKTLVPHLQNWLYASRTQGKFEKRYQDLCIICDIEVFRFLSHIQRQLQQAMDELLKGGYIGGWDVISTLDGKDFKVILEHGPKFQEDQLLWTGKQEKPKPIQTTDLPPLYQALLDQGVTPTIARKLCKDIPDDELGAALEKVEYCVSVEASSRGKIGNLAGFIVTFLRNGDQIPKGFIGSKKAAEINAEQERRQKVNVQRMLLEVEYDHYMEAALDDLIAKVPEGELENSRKAHFKQVSRAYPNMPSKHVKQTAEQRIRMELRQQASLPSFDEFCQNFEPQLGFQF